MMPVSTAAEVRELDRQVIEVLGVPGVCLMETASRAVAVAVAEHHAGAARAGVVVVCGPGNNGGDGYGMARWLHSWGFPVSLWSLGSASRGDAAAMRSACERLGLPEVTGLDGAGLIVDAVFGTGLDREVGGRYREVLLAMDAHPAPVVAVDIPSGLHADTGAVLGVAVRAVRTVTFGRLKLGMCGEPGADHCGAVSVADIGLGCAEVPPSAEIPHPNDLLPHWPRREPGDHKKLSGHLLVLAGSLTMAGPAVLACRGALATGVGSITLCVPELALPRLTQLPPEVMVVTSGEGSLFEPLDDNVFVDRTAAVVGPGLAGGVGDLRPAVAAFLRRAWQRLDYPLVYDADAVTCAEGPARGDRVLTPHPGEAGRILGRSADDVQADRFGAARQLASQGSTAVLKGRNTVVAHPGERLSINPTGNAILASAGSGDVLAGVVGALLARGVPGYQAARLGAWVHGRAADRLLDARSQGWTAHDVADEVPDAIEDLLDAGRLTTTGAGLP